MATKKTKETKAKDTKTSKTKKATSKPKTTKKGAVKGDAVINGSVTEEQIKDLVDSGVCEDQSSNTELVEKTTEEIDEAVTAVEFDKETQNVVFKNEEETVAEVEVDAIVEPEPTPEEIEVMRELANKDDATLEYAMSVLEKVQEVTQQEEVIEENTYEYNPTTDKNESNTVSEVEPVTVTEETSPGTCNEEKQVEELAKPEKPIKKTWFNSYKRKFSWMGKMFDI